MYRLLFFIWKLIRPRKDLASRYGRGSWALVTGASDGIGKQIAIQLSRCGFKIILIARNPQKLRAVADLMTTECQIVVADFTHAAKDDFIEAIISQTQGKDISILVNNVGVDLFDQFHKLEDREIKELITINCLPLTLLTRRLLPVMRSRRPLRSAVVNVTSLAGEFPTSYFNVYSASKAFGDFLTKSISFEYPEMDIISLKPSEVSTNMTFNRPPDLLTITPQDCASGLLRQLGYGEDTNGDWRHELQGALYRLVPLSLYNWVLIKVRTS